MQSKEVLPDGLKKFTNCHGFFRLGSKDMDNVVIQTIGVYVRVCKNLALVCRKHVTNKLCGDLSVL